MYITLPASIKTIGKQAFKACTKLTATIKQADPAQITSVAVDAFDDVEKILVPASSVAAYKAASRWSKWRDKIFAIPVKKLALRLTTYKTLLTPEDIVAQVTELSGRRFRE